MTSIATQQVLNPAKNRYPRPFLKWAGGKTQLLPEILARFPKKFNRYFEPFIGGGAVFFGLAPQKAFISDINEHLIRTYLAIRDELPQVMRILRTHRATEEHFYHIRSQNPQTMSNVHAAARTIFLNRTCFNGLYRVNRKDQFNVPFGRYANPTICDTQNLTNVSQILHGVDIRVASVFKSVSRARRGDLIYFDPPYDPVSPTASFTAYTSTPFGKKEQAKLAQAFTLLAKRGVHVVLSNSDTPYIRQLYQNFRCDSVYARRAINSRADRRGPVTELLISNT